MELCLTKVHAASGLLEIDVQGGSVSRSTEIGAVPFPTRQSRGHGSNEHQFLGFSHYV